LMPPDIGGINEIYIDCLRRRVAGAAS